MDVVCPYCGTSYVCASRDYGRYVECAVCQKGFVVGQCGITRRRLAEHEDACHEGIGQSSAVSCRDVPLACDRREDDSFVACESAGDGRNAGVMPVLLERVSPPVGFSDSAGINTKKRHVLFVAGITIIFPILAVAVLSSKQTAKGGHGNEKDPVRADSRYDGNGNSVSRSGEAHTPTYYSSDMLDLNVDAKPCSTGVLGFLWGERPRRSEYRMPCIVEYQVRHGVYGLYNRVQLLYGKNGLSNVCLMAPQPNRLPSYDDLPMHVRKDCQNEFIRTACLPVFETMRQIAIDVLRQKVNWFVGRDCISGLSEDDGDDYFGCLRLDLKGKEAVMLFSIFWKPQRQR